MPTKRNALPATQPAAQKKNDLDLSDLSGDISKPIIFPDPHFGLEEQVWLEAQKVAALLPVEVRAYGDLDDEYVQQITDSAKGAEIQGKMWTESRAQVEKYLKGLKKIREEQSTQALKVAEARVELAELEKTLKTDLANNESKYRNIVGNSRSSIASVQDSLAINLGNIAAKYSEGKATKLAKATEEKTPREPTEFETQVSSVVQKFRENQAARWAIAPGITQRLKSK